MSQLIRPRRVNHMNAVLPDFDASVDHFRKLYDAEFVVDIPQREFHACLIEMGRVLFELFVPHDQLVIARYGPHYVGIEYEADMDEVREAIAARGIRIIRDIGIALHTHPADCFGVSFEFTDQYFHDRDWPLLGGPMKSAEYWRHHPLGLTGLKGNAVAVHEIDAAREFFQSFLAAEVVYEEPRPAVAARAVGLRVADAVIELITPAGEGALQRHLHRFGDGIRSTVFRVGDIERAKRYFAERRINLLPGDAPNTWAIPPDDNLGLIFEFSQ
jgi:catechol 2,3-dioxygenase-like lactoylglutathione lyase family enzyme